MGLHHHPFSPSLALSVIFATFIPVHFETVEQTLLIDLANRHSANAQQFGEVEGVENLLTIMRGVKERRPKWRHTENGAAESTEPLLQKLEQMISWLSKMFSQRFDQLSKRIERMEANQRNFMKGTDWVAISREKRIRPFINERNWTEANIICAEMNGSLLEIKSDGEKRRTIDELLKNTADSFWWVGVPMTPREAHNDNAKLRSRGAFDSGEQWEQRKQKTCTGITVEKWVQQRTDRECDEKHKFICQI